MLSSSAMEKLKNLRVKFNVAVAVSQCVDFPLHLLVLCQGSLLFTMVVEEDGKVEVDQRVGTGTTEDVKQSSNAQGESLHV